MERSGTNVIRAGVGPATSVGAKSAIQAVVGRPSPARRAASNSIRERIDPSGQSKMAGNVHPVVPLSGAEAGPGPSQSDRPAECCLRTSCSVNGHHPALLRRHQRNPILRASDWPYPVNTVFNAGATVLQDGTTLLLCRVEDRTGKSHLCAARSANGVDNWQIDPEPTLMYDPDHYPEERWGIEDPRITYVPELGRYAVVYTSFSRGGPCVSLALTDDFRRYERYGGIMPPEDKDAALLPHRIGDYWALIHRPVSGIGAHIWISYSPDLRHWGSHKLILEARRGGWWDANKIGLSPPMIETPDGWLMIYHGVRTTASGSLYRLGLALFDRETPERCLLRSQSWIFGPEEAYERFGDVGNVVFPCGFTLHDGGDTIYLYYGGADTCINLATGSVRALLEWLKECGQPGGGPLD